MYSYRSHSTVTHSLAEACLFVLVILAALFLTSIAFGQPGQRSVDIQFQEYLDDMDLSNESIRFNFGDSCERLTFLPQENLREIFSRRFEDQWETFCIIDYMNECSDFNSYIEAFGTLGPSPNAFEYCQFISKPVMHKDLPLIYKNMG